MTNVIAQKTEEENELKKQLNETRSLIDDKKLTIA